MGFNSGLKGLKMEAEGLSGTLVNFYYIARRNITCEITFMLKI
jgi:hypothetical protein